MLTPHPAITHATALHLIGLAIDRAAALGQKVSVAVVDNHGNLKAFARMDGSSFGSGEIARQKALTSASLPFSTRRMGERNVAMASAPFTGGAIAGAIMLPGGIPIFGQDGSHLGGFGLSGAAPDVDEEIAEWVLAAVLPKKDA